MNSNTLTSTGNHPCILVSTSTATATNNSPITVSPTTNSTVLAKLTDRATYFAVVSDTCAFNRDLCKTRCSRLPFLDLATQISQRPAPWLYHTNREYSRETLSKDPHVFLRYPRYRWHLDPQSPHKKRKAANQRLWYTLQNSLKALGIPPDLVPVVTRRAYSIAGLTIPSSLANYLDVLNPRVSSISYAAANNNNCNTLNTSTGSANRFQHSSSFGTIVNVNSNSIPRKSFCHNNHGEYTYDTTMTLHDDEEHDFTVSDRSQDSECFLNGRLGGGGDGDDSTQPFDGLITANKRMNGTKLNSDDFNISDRKDIQDDSRDTNHANNSKHTMSNKSDYCKTYDLDNVSEDGDDENGKYNEDDNGEDGEDMDDDDCNDTEWLSERRRRGGGNGNLLSCGSGDGGVNADGSRRRGKTRSVYSLKVAKLNRKIVNQKASRSSQAFPMLANRLGGRKFTKSHLGRPFAGRLRANESHVDDISYTFTKSSPSVGRRGSRAITRLGTRHIGDSLKTLQQYGTIREKINEYNDTWDVDNEPGYQLNATPITPTTTEKRESQTLGDCNSNDRFNASNIYPSLSPSSTNPFYHHHSSIMSNDRSLSTLYEAHLQNRSYPEDNLPSFSSQSKLFRSSGTPMNWSHLLCPNQSNTGTSPSTTVSLTSSSTSSCVLSSSSPMDSCRITEQSDNVCTPRHSDSNNESVMHVGELSANHEPSPHRISPIHRANMSKLSNSVNVVNRNNSVPIPTDSAHSTTSINNTVAVVNPTFSNIDHKSNNNNNNNNNTLNTQGNSNMMRTVDFSSVTDKSNNGRVVGDLQTFVNPQTATTTVTFFICEVCSSRYRSTAGLRYHYHSQHSGYTPQNPISASASRLVVPVGEERGIGGGLRGGRPRRHRGSTASSKSRDKSSNSHYSTEYQGSSEQDERSNSFLAAHYSRASNQSTNAYSPSQSNKRGNNTNRADSKPIDSRSIVEPKLIDLITNQPTSSKYREKGHPNHFNSVESDGSNGNNSNTNELSNNNSMSSVEMKKSSFFMNSNNGDRFPQCSMPSSSVTVGKFIDSTDSLNLSNASSRYQVMDYTSNSNPTISSSSIGSIPHSNILSAQQQNSLQLSSFNSLETHFGNSMPNNKVHPYIPYSHHHPYQSTLQQPQPSTQNWNSQHTGFNQLSFVPSSVPNSHSSFPRPPQQQQSSTIISRIGPQQRRYERQHCADRLGLVRSPVNPSTSTSSMLLPSSSSTCDYCLGDDTLNPRIGHPEGMLQCSRCGHSAHYTCLRLPPHIIDAAMRYPWQCIECKTCWLCDQDDHEDRMIFCWDCDRVFHAHCLQSRLPRNPDTHWTCDICLHEMYNVSNSSIEQRAHSNSGYEAYSSNNSSSHNNNSSLNQVNNADGYYTNVQHYAHNIPRL